MSRETVNRIAHNYAVAALYADTDSARNYWQNRLFRFRKQFGA